MKFYRLLFALFVFGAACWGQKPADDPIAQALFPPELVMKYRQEINLDEGQSKAMKEAIQKAQTKFLDMQWDMQSEAEKLIKLLKARPVDESAVMAQMDQVLNREREIKKAQISLLVHIKNLLSEPQQNKLTELRQKPS
ncbi:MAG TPA: periplasmic heavy metal sensor [Candidatus Polarisedimenticolia bacterium]|nr:periplasmic heavy metal sensor [Candidatus Polarisedimenticolia bacterium]